jgi:hypothetical protein
MVRLYFDTNVYRFINEIKEIERIAQLLAERDCILVASSTNLFETYAITSPLERERELKAIVALADDFESYPESWWHAVELRREIKRLRPGWLRSVGSKRQLRDFLRGHRALWEEARRGIMPDPDTYAVFRRDSEGGVKNLRGGQQEQRQALRGGAKNFTLRTIYGESLRVEIGDPEIYWRWECLQVWYNALELGMPASRDYADWLRPYLRRGCFRDRSYTSFWLSEAMSDALPLNRLTGLVAFYQLQQKITHGNAADQLHATRWLTSDMFVTADRAFHEILTAVATHHFPNRPHPVLVNRSASTMSDQLESLLASWRPVATA